MFYYLWFDFDVLCVGWWCGGEVYFVLGIGLVIDVCLCQYGYQGDIELQGMYVNFFCEIQGEVYWIDWCFM